MPLVDGVARRFDDWLRADGHRDVERSSGLYSEEAGRGDADDLERMTVEADRPADGRRLTAVLPLPERVADDDAWRCATADVVLRSQQPAGERRDAQDVEEPAAHPQSLDGARLSAFGEIECLDVPRKDSGEGLLVRSNLLPDWIGEHDATAREVAASKRFVRQMHLDESLGINHRQHLELHGVEQLKDRGVRADAEGQR